MQTTQRLLNAVGTSKARGALRFSKSRGSKMLYCSIGVCVALAACSGQRSPTEAERDKASQNISAALNPVCRIGLVPCDGQTERLARCIVDRSEANDVIELAQAGPLQNLGLVANMIASKEGVGCVIGDADVNSPAAFALRSALSGMK